MSGYDNYDNYDSSFNDAETEGSFQKMIRDLDNLLQRRPQPAPSEFPTKTEMSNVIRCLDKMEDDISVFLYCTEKDLKDVKDPDFTRKQQMRYSDNTLYPQSSSVSSSSRRNITNSHSPNPNFHQSRERERTKQNSYTPNPYVPKTPVRRKSSKAPISQDALSDEEFSTRHIRKKARTSQNLGKRPLARRKCTEAGAQTPESVVGTPTIECSTPLKPVNSTFFNNNLLSKVNNRVATIKDNVQNSPGSSVHSPLPTVAFAHDPNSTSNICKILQESSFFFNAPQFHDPRPKPEVVQDFSKSKGTFSIPIHTFQTYSEAYLRPLTQNDLKILEPHNLEYEYLVVPSPPNSSKDSEEKPKSRVKGFSVNEATSSANSPNSEFFTQRLFSALLPEIQSNEISQSLSDEEEQIIVDEIPPEEAHTKIATSLPDGTSFEARVKFELSLLGLVQKDSAPQPPLDEITTQLMKLQTQLKDLNRYNNSRKMKLREMTINHLAYQDYTHIMDAFDNKLETAHLKKISIAKAKRKRFALLRGVPEGVPAILEQRSKFCSIIGKSFKPDQLQLPQTSRYEEIPCPSSLKDILM